jgi:hypothetical protein
MQAFLIALTVAVVSIVIGLKMILRLPGLPYNVAELFLDSGSVRALTLFALALLWIGAGSFVMARWLRRSRRPALVLPVAMVILAMVSRTLLKYSVTYESLDDILGTNNVFSIVTVGHAWGEWWRHTFLALHAEDFVSYFERRVRFIGLYSPLAVCLTLGFLTMSDGRRARFERRHIVWLLIVAAAWVWLSMTIVIAWAATDNLTELIAAKGPFGLGGAPYLLLIAVLIAANVMVLLAAGRNWVRWLIAIGVSIAAIPLGWTLQGLGLERHVQKYGLVFSGTQFLLGPDRQHTLSDSALFTRWAFVQTGGVLVIFAGAWMASRLLTAGGLKNQ